MTLSRNLEEVEETGENCTTRNFMICVPTKKIIMLII
jgi:hypothetical protein